MAEVTYSWQRSLNCSEKIRAQLKICHGPLIFSQPNSRDLTAEHSRPAAGFGVVVGIEVNVKHRNKWTEKGGTRGKVTAPPTTPQNGSVVHCSPQLEDLKQPTGEGSQGPGYTFWRRFSSSSLTCLSFHPSTTLLLPAGQSVQDNTPRPKQAGTENSFIQNKTRQIPQPHPKLAQHPQGLRDIFHGSVPPCHTTTWIEIGYQDPGNPRRPNLIVCVSVARSRNHETTTNG